MLAQAAPPDLAPVIAWLTSLVVLFVPGARGLTWIVDQVRNAMGDRGADPSLRWLWPVIAVVVALVSCLLFQINVVAPAFRNVPAFLGSTALDGFWGQVVTALGLAGLASSWHDRDAAKARANIALPTVRP